MCWPLREQFLPPNINFVEPDPAWKFEVVGNKSRTARLNYVALEFHWIRRDERHADPEASMSFFIQGIGVVTPLGPTGSETWSALCRGQQARRILFANGLADRSYYSCPVPAKFVADAARQPRLRRSGTISLLGAAAGFDAFADAGLKPAAD